MIVSEGPFAQLVCGKFEFIESGFQTGSFNMLFDLQRTLDCSEGKALPMFRIYGWKPWAVSLGFNQKEEDIDKELCKKYGFDLVRRPTGGRAVLHSNELTYSVVLPVPPNASVHSLYRDIHFILLEGLRRLGSEEIDFEKSQPNFREVYQRDTLSVSCFASSARYEIMARGKKIVGSAQRLFGNTLLQHGSILIGKGHEMLADVSKLSDDTKREALKKYILNHSITLDEVLGRNLTFVECSEVLKETVIK